MTLSQPDEPGRPAPAPAREAQTPQQQAPQQQAPQQQIQQQQAPQQQAPQQQAPQQQAPQQQILQQQILQPETASVPGREQAPAVGSRRTRGAVAAVAVLVLAADQVSKSLVLSAAPHGSTGAGLLSVRLVRNTGASFGIGAGHPLLITMTAAVLLAVALVLLARTRGRAAALSLAAVAGGAAGNLADRLLRGPGLGRGAVVDWIHLSLYPATFNIADIAIRLGALCAIIAVISSSRRRGVSPPLHWRRAIADHVRDRAAASCGPSR